MALAPGAIEYINPITTLPFGAIPCDVVATPTMENPAGVGTVSVLVVVVVMLAEQIGQITRSDAVPGEKLLEAIAVPLPVVETEEPS